MAAPTTTSSPELPLSKNTIIIQKAEQIIARWDPNTSPSPRSIFHHGRDEALRFLAAVHHLHHSMQSSTTLSEGSLLLLRRYTLMQTAMDRLKKELAQMATSADGEGTAINLDDLRAVVECMVSCGHARECLETYRLRRRVVVQESLSRLGLELSILTISSSQVQKLDWESMDIRTNKWLAASRAIFHDIFMAERRLCHLVFASSEPIGDSCFAEITGDAAVQFFKFPYSMTTKKSKRTPEKILTSYLNMYRNIVDLAPEIESAFSSKPTRMVRSQARASLDKLAQTIKSTLADFERTVHEDHESNCLPRGGGLHALTLSVMNHLVLLADHCDILTHIYPDDPLPCHADRIQETGAHRRSTVLDM